jgi:hypothetical protein
VLKVALGWSFNCACLRSFINYALIGGSSVGVAFFFLMFATLTNSSDVVLEIIWCFVDSLIFEKFMFTVPVLVVILTLFSCAVAVLWDMAAMIAASHII